MYILLAILVFGFLIFIHELGHFLTAKWLGVQVNEFSICMGPKDFSKEKGGNGVLPAVHPDWRLLRHGG